MALDILSESPECLKSMPAYAKAFDEANYLFDRRRRDLLWKIDEKLFGEDKISQRAVELFYEQIDGLIRRRMETMNKCYKPNPEAGVDLLDLFLQSTQDVYTLRGMAFAFLSAGRDTTAYSITWLMKEIHHQDNKHLDAANRIRAKELGFISEFLSYGDAPKLKFANAMWDENARLNTVSPAGQMEAAEGDTLPAVPELNMPPRHIFRK
ncbi:cytochrome P450 [Camillea tinctor]|nr:cytochrome P450 [Camillea tinctor]